MYKVLLVDDEILVREAISENIKWNDLGYELVKVCENGKLAMEFLAEHPVDLVLTDICMPYMDGMELSRYVYENHPKTAIIIFSGYGEFEYAKQAIKYKVSEYILKPVTAKELSEILARLHTKLDSEHKEAEKVAMLSKVYENYTKNEALIVSSALSSLVKGTRNVEESMRELHDLGISIEGSYYRIAALDIDIYSDLYEINERQKKESALMAFVVENISSELVTRDGHGLVYRDSDNRVCLLLCTNKPREFRNTAQELCSKITEHIYEAMKLTISIGLGIYVEDLNALYLSYKSALDVLKYRYTKGKGFMYDCEEHGGNSETVIDLEEPLKSIPHALKMADQDMVKSILGEIETAINKGFVSKDNVVSYLHRILHAIKASVDETGGKIQEAPLGEVSEARNFVQAMEIVKQFSQQAMECLCEIGQSTGARQAALALHYIKENYGNPDVSLNSICSYLNISTSHFSNIFKEATGGTFTEVLTNIRMDKAKQLLKETTLKNYEIAERVGFSDPHYFSIAFKKMTGKTPKEYAKENR